MPNVRIDKGNPNRDLLMSEDICVSTVMAIVLDALVDTESEIAADDIGIPVLNEVLGRDIESIIYDVGEEFNVVLPSSFIGKWVTGVRLLTTDDFYTSVPAFVEMCNILNNNPGLPGVVEPADLEDIAYGVGEAMLLAPPEDESSITAVYDAFNPAITLYIEEILRLNDITVPPTCLSFIPSSNIVNDNADSVSQDISLYQASYEIGQERNQDIQTYVDNKMRQLISQLKQVKYKQGNFGNFVNQLRK